MKSSTDAAAELARLRRRSEADRARLSRLGSDAPTASGASLARVVDLGAKSGTARSVVAVVPVRIAVDQVEGATPVLTAADTTEAYLAVNLGNTLAPVGLDVLVDVVDGIPVFRHG